MDILNQFGINPLLLAAQVVNFAILLFILKRFLYKPILKVLEDRKRKIEESLKNADEIERKLVEIEERQTEVLLKAATESEKIIKAAKEDAVLIIDEGHKTSEKIINNAYEESKKILQNERFKLEQEVKDNLSNIVTLALEKITGKVITPADQKRIIEKEVKNLS